VLVPDATNVEDSGGPARTRTPGGKQGRDGHNVALRAQGASAGTGP